MKKVLICGISGQDGAHLAQFLLSKGYEVYGTSRDAQVSGFHNLKYLGIYDQIKLASMALNDFRSVLQVLTNIQPDEMYNLAGQTSVSLSFQQPVETLENIRVGTLNILEDFVETAFSYCGLDWHDHVEIDQQLMRSSDLKTGIADISKAQEKLGWKPKYLMKDVVRMMVDEEMKFIRQQ